MKRTLTAITLALGLATTAHAATYRTCAPFQFLEDANTFMNLSLTQVQRDAAQIVPLQPYSCPGDSSCAVFMWVVEFPTTALDASTQGCGKVPGFSGAQSSKGPCGF